MVRVCGTGESIHWVLRPNSPLLRTAPLWRPRGGGGGRGRSERRPCRGAGRSVSLHVPGLLWGVACGYATGRSDRAAGFTLKPATGPTGHGMTHAKVRFYEIWVSTAHSYSLQCDKFLQLHACNWGSLEGNNRGRLISIQYSFWHIPLSSWISTYRRLANFFFLACSAIETIGSRCSASNLYKNVYGRY